MKITSTLARHKLNKAIVLALAATAFTVFTAANAVAQETSSLSEWSDSYYYWGLAGGQARAKFDQQRLINSRIAPTVASTGISGSDNKDQAFRIFGGYQLNRNWAFETAYFDLGRSSFSSFTVPTGVVNGEVKVRGVSLDLVGTLPLSDRFALLGRVGGHYTRTQDAFSGSGAASFASGSASARKTQGKVGAGMQYAFSSGFMMRLESDRYRVNDAVGSKGNINTTMLSLVFPLNRTRVVMLAPPTPAYVAPAPVPAPAYVAPAPTPMPAPAPAPIVVPPPVVPATPSMRRVSFSAESLFAFNKSDIRPEGMASLDAFARELQTTRFEQINVIGHTDRVGTTVYNQRLSERRAAAVKAYLVSAGRVDVARIVSSGKGKDSPITSGAQCVGTRPTPKLIACLQPDRRVDVEVTGMR